MRLCQQDDFLFDELTASEHLELVCRLRGIDQKDQIAQVIADKAKEVDVETEIHKKVKFISPGAKRKLSIAMALIGDAKFIILDEPTSNLDLKSREKIWFLIKKIAQQKERCILISTQHIEEADFIGTKICIIKDGKMSQCDTPENLKRKFGNGFKVKMVSDETRHQKYFKEK